ncbi:MAG: hypothetical protein BWK78_01445 [Thiotrichaceae bacterium IS1]|nr:MAG: hypothetical protein BWK78_01445 [Thiotrichaceae bacterium IS1]
MTIPITGTAVFTRGHSRGQDYNWYIKRGKLELFEEIENLHDLLLGSFSILRSTDERLPKLAIIIRSSKVGVLLDDIPSERVDFSNRSIFSTLCFEVEQQYQKNIFELIANLLIFQQENYKIYEKYFSDYTEALYQIGQTADDIPLEKIVLPILEGRELDESLPSITQDHLALYANSVNRSRCAKYLRELVISEKISFCFVSAGEMNIATCQEIAKKVDRCIMLTFSSELLREINLNPKTTKELLAERFYQIQQKNWYRKFLSKN